VALFRIDTPIRPSPNFPYTFRFFVFREDFCGGIATPIAIGEAGATGGITSSTTRAIGAIGAIGGGTATPSAIGGGTATPSAIGGVIGEGTATPSAIGGVIGSRFLVRFHSRYVGFLPFLIHPYGGSWLLGRELMVVLMVVLGETLMLLWSVRAHRLGPFNCSGNDIETPI